MKHTSKYFFSIVLIMCCLNTFSQEKKQDSLQAKTERYGLRFGIDLYKIGKSIADKNYKGIEIVGDYRIAKKYFLAAEIGTESKTDQDKLLNFSTNGTYLKAGFDYNAHENWLDLENMIYFGVRYSASTFSQKINSYTVYNQDHYFDAAPPIMANQKFDGLTAQWLEVVFGLKTRVINNIFVGFSLRTNMLIVNTKPDNFDNLYIPGFNSTYDGNFGVGFNYTVSYLFPFYKKITQK